MASMRIALPSDSHLTSGLRARLLLPFRLQLLIYRETEGGFDNCERNVASHEMSETAS